MPLPRRLGPESAYAIARSFDMTPMSLAEEFFELWNKALRQIANLAADARV